MKVLIVSSGNAGQMAGRELRSWGLNQRALQRGCISSVGKKCFLKKLIQQISWSGLLKAFPKVQKQ